MTFAEDLEKLIGWRMEYLLANRNVRNYVARLRAEDYHTVCSDLLTNGDGTPEFLLFRGLVKKLYILYRGMNGNELLKRGVER